MTLLLLAGLTLATPEARADSCPQVDGASICEDAAVDPLRVRKGQVTFDSEGNDNASSRYFSRTLHWPGGASGVTIGRGYDMKYRSGDVVKADLLKAGVPEETAARLASGAGLTGSAAEAFAGNNKALLLTGAQQKQLFETIYDEYEADTQRLVCKWQGVSGAACDALWDGMDGSIQQVLVDLRYRGDLTRKRWQRWLSKPATRNNLKRFAKVMGSARKWSKVPEDRFDRRRAFIDAAHRADQSRPRRPRQRLEQ